MKIDRIWLAGMTITIIMLILIVTFISENSFPAFTLAKDGWMAVKVSDLMGAETARFMWKHRSLDLIAQILVLFGAAAGCIIILRREEGKMR